MVKLKIIDPTFNFMAFINNPAIKFHKYITVNIYSLSLSGCPKIKNVGDIMRMRRFNVGLAVKSSSSSMIEARSLAIRTIIRTGLSTRVAKEAVSRLLPLER